MVFYIQKKVITFLKSQNNKLSLALLAEDNCSELSRLAGYWLLEEFPLIKIRVLKGDNIMNEKNKSHELLAISEKEKIYIVDVTVWQYFKKKKSILIKETDNLAGAIDYLKEKYGGEWIVNDDITKKSRKYIKKWENIIKTNINVPKA